MEIIRQALVMFYNHMSGIMVVFGGIFIVLGSFFLLKSKRRLTEMVESLKKGEDNHRLLIKTVPSVVYKGYADWSVDFFDDKFEKASGYAVEDFNSRKLKWDEIILPEDLEGAKEVFKQALKGNKFYTREYRIKLKSGKIVWIRERAQIILDKDGKIEYVIGLYTDITEEHQMAATLAEQEENFRMLVRSVPAIVFKGDSDGSVDFFIDDKIRALTGYSLDDFASHRKRWTDLIFPGDLEKCKESLKQALKTDHKSYMREYRIKVKSGKLLWIRERARIICDENDRIAYIIGIFSDITEEHEMGAALEKLRLQNEMILNSIGEGLFGLDSTGKVTFINTAALSLTGFKADDLMGQSFHQLTHYKKLDGSPYPQQECPIHATLRYGDKHRIDDIFWTKDGSPLPVEYMTNPIEQNGKVVGAVGVFRDITLRKRGEAEVKKAYNYLNNVLDNTAEAIGIVDRHGVVEKWNKACEDIYGYSFDELQGKPAFDLYADKDELAKMLVQLRQDGFVRHYEIKMKRKDGSTFPCSLSVKVLRDAEGKNMGSVTVARDLTEMKDNLEKLQSANTKLQALVDESNQRNRNMTLLQEMSDVFQSCQTSGEAYSAIAHFAPKFFPDYAGALYILNGAKDLFELTAVWGEASAVELAFGHDECWSLRRTRAYLVPDSTQTMNCRHVSGDLPGSYLCVPMMAQGEIMGIFHLQKPATERPDQMKVISQFVTTVAEAMALALANLKLRETLRNQAIRDALTGLFNRRYLEETMERELSRNKRQGTALGVIMLDLDHFKEYNDTYGHNSGDELLVALGQLIQDQVRREDIACRYGGEEFLLVMPGASTEVTLQRAQELNQAVKQLHTSSSSLKPITISAGVAIYPNNGANAKDVIRAADAALYRAKAEGRDRVVVANGLESMAAAN
jgi:diguanylate cyclase (GGDEF)-like protein/PAS domain S-box-containing protein